MQGFSDPFNKIKYTEWWACGEFKEWIGETLRAKNLNYKAHIERTIERKQRPDIVIFDKDEHVVCVIEVKPPSWDVLTVDLVKKTWYEADKVKSPYFATWNMNQFVLFSTTEYDKTRSIHDAIVQIYDAAAISEIKDIEEVEHKIRIKSFLERFLEDLILAYEGKKSIPKIPIDKYFTSRLRITVDALSNSYRETITKEAEEDLEFKKKIADWFREQAWSFADQNEDYAKLSRQAAYLLINKILFYTALQEKYDLDPLEIPNGLRSGEILEKILKIFFERVLRIDYETIFTMEFIDEIAFPEDAAAVESIRDLINDINRHKISSVGYDILGSIFENLIPESERHKLGQYFTNSDVVDLILRFCLRDEQDVIIDPSCGAGTFLVRAYSHKKLMNPRLKHEDILPTLWGNDIAKFASHLSTINLAIKDLGAIENYPRIIHADFFDLEPSKIGFGVPPKSRVKGLGEEEKVFEHPEGFDAIVGNPPYTRQEEMDDLMDVGYKEGLIEKAIFYQREKLANVSKRAGIHAYFFIHGYKFLKEGGKFGFIVSNSWLDVGYGKGLQEFFLEHYKILAVIDSKVERWFTDADINTSIVILEKCGSSDKRDLNLARFVQLKRPLSDFIPQASNEWESEIKRKEMIDDLVKLILGHTNFYENDEIKIFPKRQNELWEEGFDEEEGKYVGAKWGKYIRAPQIFFNVLEKGKDIFVPLKDVAEVRRGFTTGANKFFYLTDEEIDFWKIEREFWCHKDESGGWIPNYVIKSPRECKGVVVNPDDLKYRVLMIHKDRRELEETNVLKYIEWGESQGFHERPTCRSRKRWWDLGERESRKILHPMVHDVRQVVGLNQHNVYVDHNLFEIKPLNTDWTETIASSLYSTVSIMFKEFGGRINLGQGALKTEGVDILKLFVIQPSSIPHSQTRSIKAVFDKLSQNPILSVFEEIGADSPEEVSLNKVKPDRRELDKIIMGEILGLTDEEQLEVYRAVVDLVRSRIAKAKSVKNNKKRVSNDELIAKQILDSIGGEDILKRFFGEFEDYEEIILPEFKKEVKIERSLTGWQLTDKKDRIEFENRRKAEFCRLVVLLGVRRVKIPKDLDDEMINGLNIIVKSIFKGLDERLDAVTDKKVRKRVKGQVLGKIVNGIG